MAVIAYQSPDEESAAPTGSTYTNQSKKFYSDRTSIQVVLLPELTAVAHGYMAMFNNWRLEYSGLKNVKLNGQQIFPSDTHVTYSAGFQNVGQDFEQKLGGSMGVAPSLRTDLKTAPPAGFITVPGNVDRNVNPKTVEIEGTFTVSIGAPADVPIGPANPAIQTFTFEFPKVTIPMPKQHGYPFDGMVSPTDPNKVTGKDRAKAAGAYGNVKTSLDSWRTLVPSKVDGDIRLVAATDDPSAFFEPHAEYSNSSIRIAHSLAASEIGSESLEPGGTYGSLVPSIPSSDYPTWQKPDVPAGVMVSADADWDTGPGLMRDGAWINKADDGLDNKHDGASPYIGTRFALQDTQAIGGSRFSPNRQMPSAVMFGSLSTGVKRQLPWRTLLFRPAVSYLPGGVAHPGGSGPPDHLLLDLFWMPVVEPYAISEPFSTAGKINLNTQIAPFTYLHRDTGLHAAMASLRITAINPDAPTAGGTRLVEKYNGSWAAASARSPSIGGDVSIRRLVDIPQTVRLIRERLRDNRPFLSASEICEIPLVPREEDGAAVVSDSDSLADFDTKLGQFWDSHRLTGDNALERPYAHLYPRLTTRSNTFTVHVIAQSLRKSATSPEGEFGDGQGAATGEWRGSFLVERYLDPASQTVQPGTPLGPYKLRVISSRKAGL